MKIDDNLKRQLCKAFTGARRAHEHHRRCTANLLAWIHAEEHWGGSLVTSLTKQRFRMLELCRKKLLQARPERVAAERNYAVQHCVLATAVAKLPVAVSKGIVLP